jgi:hypothetical protein
MALLSWGKPTIQHATSSDGAPSGEWTDIDTPKQDTTKITPTAGTETTAQEEGGDIVDVRNAKNTYQLEFDLFVKKGKARPFEDNDGVIAGEHAFRVIPEDDECEGAQIDRSTIRLEDSYTSADGILLHYVIRPLKPKTGKTVKPYYKSTGTTESK